MIPQDAKVTVDTGINWQHYEVKIGDLSAFFRLHKWEEPEAEFFSLLKKAKIKPELERAKSPTLESLQTGKPLKCQVLANYYGPSEGGYDNPEVIETFDWLNEMFEKAADTFEKKQATSHPGLGFLEYHGVEIVKCRR